MPLHPGVYAHMLVDRLERDDVPVWLVNTGWTGGPYGTGERMNIAHTRSMVRAALDGSLATVATRTDPIFGIDVPITCPDVPERFLDPRTTWPDPEDYDRQARVLAGMFADNFEAYADGVSDAIRSAGPRLD
jgi:phosphoenolpyruvate carboxykinase (ATP)